MSPLSDSKDSNSGVPWSEVVQKRNSAIALGNFDGVHLGHQKILSELKDNCLSSGLEPLVVTFHPHPAWYFVPHEPMPLLTTPEEKTAKIYSMFGIETRTIRFDNELSSMEPEQFALEFLIGKMRAKNIYLGPDHRFGKGARGDAQFLKKMTNETEVQVESVSPVTQDGGVISSSRIRECLKLGGVEEANKLLGYAFGYTGKVVRGEGRGKKLGFPTANLKVDPSKILPRLGVYGAEAELAGKKYPALVNIGKAPTFSPNLAKIEAYFLDFEGNLYDKTITLKLNCYLRKERKFKSAADLVAQINQDKEIFNHSATSEIR